MHHGPAAGRRAREKHMRGDGAQALPPTQASSLHTLTDRGQPRAAGMPHASSSSAHTRMHTHLRAHDQNAGPWCCWNSRLMAHAPTWHISCASVQRRRGLQSSTLADSSRRTGMRSPLLVLRAFLLPSSTTWPAVAVRRAFHTIARSAGSRPSNTWQRQGQGTDGRMRARNSSSRADRCRPCCQTWGQHWPQQHVPTSSPLSPPLVAVWGQSKQWQHQSGRLLPATPRTHQRVPLIIQLRCQQLALAGKQFGSSGLRCGVT